MLKVIGATISPWVRRVMVALEEKDIAYELEPFFPFGDPPQEFVEKSPLRLVPVLETDEGPIADSTAICTYLEARHPDRPLLPADPYERARAVWFGQYADAIFRDEGTVFFQRVVRGHLMKQEIDVAAVAEAEAKLPPYLAYLDGELEGKQTLAGDAFGLADITVASVLLNYLHTGAAIAPSTHPNLRAFLDRVFARETFRNRIDDDLKSLSEISSLAR